MQLEYSALPVSVHLPAWSCWGDSSLHDVFRDIALFLAPLSWALTLVFINRPFKQPANTRALLHALLQTRNIPNVSDDVPQRRFVPKAPEKKKKKEHNV